MPNLDQLMGHIRQKTACGSSAYRLGHAIPQFGFLERCNALLADLRLVDLEAFQQAALPGLHVETMLVGIRLTGTDRVFDRGDTGIERERRLEHTLLALRS